MSWQTYVEGPTSLVGYGKLTYAAIISAAGDSNWASTTGFDLQPDEAKNLASSIDSLNKELYTTGFYAGKMKFKCILVDDDTKTILGKKDKEGLVVIKSKQCIFVGYHPATIDTRDARAAVQGVVDYLKGTGY